MRAKFVSPPPSQAASSRIQAPAANELFDSDVLKAVRGFRRGAAPGPSGLRPDLLRQLAGEGDDVTPFAHALTSLVNLLADGQAPSHMQAYIGGARGTALRKVSKTGGPDVRPVCSGEALRRLVGKALLATEIDTLRKHLLPFQFAVGVQAGAEVLPHLARQWRSRYSADPTRVLLTFDKGNAHNEVDRHAFLTRMHELCPGLSRWLEYIYPTASATKVFYRGRIIDSRAGGQQGCPLMAACHAVVQRMLHESLGLVAPPGGSAVHVPLLQPPAALDMAPNFADDGILAGPSREVLRALRHLQRVMPSIGLRFSSLVVGPAAGERGHTVDWAPFVAAGCSVAEAGNFEILKSPVGDIDFSRDFCLQTALKQAKVVDAIGQLPDPHCAFYLLRFSGNASRMTYLTRTTPKQHCSSALTHFDFTMQEAFGHIAGLDLSPQMWLQATLAARDGGFGFRPCSDTADAAYLASRVVCQPLGEAAWDGFCWEAGQPGNFLEAAATHCNSILVAASLPDRIVVTTPDVNALRQRRIAACLDACRLWRWQQGASVADVARLNTLRAPHAGQILQVVPSPALDTHLTRQEFTTTVALCLGVDVADGNHSCGFCAMPVDSKGRHALSCMAGGDTIATHHAVQDVLHDYCDLGGLRPTLEAPNLLGELELPEGGRRPADVFLCKPGLLLKRLPHGTRQHCPRPIALDVAVINALGERHWRATAGAAGAAAAAYADLKRSHLDTFRKCHEAGIHFQPVVLEAQGGFDKDAAAIVHGIALEAAAVLRRDPASVKQEIMNKLAVVLCRAAARSIDRRRRAHRRLEARPIQLAPAPHAE